jgi:hypothetical protein
LSEVNYWVSATPGGNQGGATLRPGGAHSPPSSKPHVAGCSERLEGAIQRTQHKSNGM